MRGLTDRLTDYRSMHCASRVATDDVHVGSTSVVCGRVSTQYCNSALGAGSAIRAIMGLVALVAVLICRTSLLSAWTDRQTDGLQIRALRLACCDRRRAWWVDVSRVRSSVDAVLICRTSLLSAWTDRQIDGLQSHALRLACCDRRRACWVDVSRVRSSVDAVL